MVKICSKNNSASEIQSVRVREKSKIKVISLANKTPKAGATSSVKAMISKAKSIASVIGSKRGNENISTHESESNDIKSQRRRDGKDGEEKKRKTI